MFVINYMIADTIY